MSEPTYAASTVSAAVRATYVAFIGAGFAFATWASRIPQVRDHLGLTPATLGLVLLAIAAGSLVALPLAGVIVNRFTSRSTVAMMSALNGISLLAIALGYLVGVVPVLVGLFVFGFAMGAWDVAMNVQGALVERHLGRAIMPRFHAGYSVGTVGGALLGSAMIVLHVPVTAHLAVAGVVLGIVVPLAVRQYLPDAQETPAKAADGTSAGALARWREPRTLLVGMVVLAFAFTEGAGNDWIGVSLIDGYGTSAALGTLGFATFLAAMTGGRWFGPGLLDRYGRVVVLRVLGAVSIGGLLIFVFSPWTVLAFAGAVLWGIGASLGFPVGMSAAADDPGAAAGRVSVVASIGYCAFLGGPPLIGFLGDQFTILRALIVVAGVLAVATLLVPALRPLPVAEGADADADVAKR